MNKITLSLLLLAAPAFVAYAQNGGDDNKDAPPVSEAGQSQVASFFSESESEFVSEQAEGWYCEFEFYYNGKSYYSEYVGFDDTEAYRGSLSNKLDNKIDSIYWSGSRCNCWIIVYQSKYFKGLNLGLWTDSNDGYYDLTKYITYDFYDGGWEPWYKVVSSYSIYCY